MNRSNKKLFTLIVTYTSKPRTLSLILGNISPSENLAVTSLLISLPIIVDMFLDYYIQ